MTVAICDDPDCGTSRNALPMIRASVDEPEVIELLTDPPGRERPEARIAAGLVWREAIRQKGTRHEDPGRGALGPAHDQLRDVRSILISRPIVVAPFGERLARQSEVVRQAQENPVAEFTTEDDHRVVRAPARRGTELSASAP